MKICFFSLPLFGHNNYGLKIAAELIRRNHEVHFYTGRKYEKLVMERGIYFKAYSDAVEKMFSGSAYDSSKTRKIQSEKVDYYSELYLLALHLFSVTDSIIKLDLDGIRAERYDAVFFDNIAIWGGKIGRILNIPTFASGTPYVYSREMIDKYPLEFAEKVLKNANTSGRSVKRFLNMCNLQLWSKFPDLKDLSVTTNYSGSGDINFIYTSTQFQLHPELIDDKKNLFVGIIMSDNDFPDCSQLFDPQRKNIFVSLGTVFNNIAVYDLCIVCLRKLNYNVIINIGMANSEGDFEEMPEEWHVGAMFPQLQILRNIDLFITHGGANSAREAAYFGVPMIVFPQSSDQFLAGKDIERNGLGVVFEKAVTVEELTVAVKETISDKELKERCKALSGKMQSLGGIDQVVEVIENKVKEWKNE